MGEGFRHDGGFPASEALDSEVSWGWITEDRPRLMAEASPSTCGPRTPGQRKTLREKAGGEDAGFVLGRVCWKGLWSKQGLSGEWF